jgi:stage V sporulation protein B
LCPLVPFLYLDSIVDAMLKGMNEQIYSLKVNMTDSCIRIGLIIVLLPKFGMTGFLIATFFSGFYNSSLSIGRLIIKSKLKFSVWKWIALPIVNISCAAFLARAVVGSFNLGNTTVLIVKITVTVTLYALLTVVTGAFEKNDMRTAFASKGVSTGMKSRYGKTA